MERRVFTAGENKSFLDPFLKVNKKDEIKLKDLQKQIHQNFITYPTIFQAITSCFCMFSRQKPSANAIV